MGGSRLPYVSFDRIRRRYVVMFVDDGVGRGCLFLFLIVGVEDLLRLFSHRERGGV